MGWFKNMVMKILRIQPAQDNKTIIIQEPFSYQTSVLRNRLWYRGDPSELDQFYKQTASDSVSKSAFGRLYLLRISRSEKFTQDCLL